MADTCPPEYDPLAAVKRVYAELNRGSRARTRAELREVIANVRAELAGTVGYWTERNR